MTTAKFQSTFDGHEAFAATLFTGHCVPNYRLGLKKF